MSEPHLLYGEVGIFWPGQEHRRYGTLDWTVEPTRLSWHLLLQEAFRDLAQPWDPGSPRSAHLCLPRTGLGNVDGEGAGGAGFAEAGEVLAFFVTLERQSLHLPASLGVHRGVTWERSCFLPRVNAHCCFPSRSHLQPPSYGPVLSPMNKVHGGVNKLPSVNQLVGQPPPHSSAAGPNLGPMGEFPGQQRRPCGPQGPKGGPGWIYRDHKQMMGGL